MKVIREKELRNVRYILRLANSIAKHLANENAQMLNGCDILVEGSKYELDFNVVNGVAKFWVHRYVNNGLEPVSIREIRGEGADAAEKALKRGRPASLRKLVA